MSRPKKTECRSVRLNLRFTPSEWVEVAPRLAASGMAPTAYCQWVVLHPQAGAAGPQGAMTRVDPALVVAINQIGVSLHLIARNLRSGAGSVPPYLTETLVRVNQYLDQVQA